MLPNARVLHTLCDPYPHGPISWRPLIRQLNGSSPAGNGGSGGIPKGNNDPGGDSLARGPMQPPTPPPDDSNKSKPSRPLFDSKTVSLPAPFKHSGTLNADGGDEDPEPTPEPAPVTGSMPVSSSSFEAETTKAQPSSWLPRQGALQGRYGGDLGSVARFGSAEMKSTFEHFDGPR